MPRPRVGSNVVDLNLLLTNNAPLSWDDRRTLLHMVETDFKDVSHTQQHLSDEEVKRNILHRVSFAHFPGLSVCEVGFDNGTVGDDTSTPSSSSLSPSPRTLRTSTRATPSLIDSSRSDLKTPHLLH